MVCDGRMLMANPSCAICATFVAVSRVSPGCLPGLPLSPGWAPAVSRGLVGPVGGPRVSPGGSGLCFALHVLISNFGDWVSNECRTYVSDFDRKWVHKAPIWMKIVGIVPVSRGEAEFDGPEVDFL